MHNKNLLNYNLKREVILSISDYFLRERPKIINVALITLIIDFANTCTKEDFPVLFETFNIFVIDLT